MVYTQKWGEWSGTRVSGRPVAEGHFASEQEEVCLPFGMANGQKWLRRSHTGIV